MNSAAKLRSQIEGALARKIPAALTPQVRVARDVVETGIDAIDAILEGGLPIGAISEITGPESAGRVTLSLAFLAGLTRSGNVCAWVDAADSLDPESAAASGITLERLLWVRCGSPTETLPVPAPSAGTQYAVTSAAPGPGSCGGPHPRSEVRGLPEAIGALFSGTRQHPEPGTPGAPNRSLSPKSNPRVEQVDHGRLPPRRGDSMLVKLAAIAPHCAEPLSKPRPSPISVTAIPSPSPDVPRQRQPKKLWTALDQAIQATDLLLQAGGFSSIVMDMSAIDPEFVHRIPLSTWYRFRAAADRARTALLVLTRHPCTQSSAEVLLRMAARPPGPGTVMQSLPFTVEVLRQRFTGYPSNVVAMRKPPRTATAADWTAPTACTLPSRPPGAIR